MHHIQTHTLTPNSLYLPSESRGMHHIYSVKCSISLLNPEACTTFKPRNLTPKPSLLSKSKCMHHIQTQNLTPKLSISLLNPNACTTFKPRNLTPKPSLSSLNPNPCTNLNHYLPSESRGMHQPESLSPI